LRAQDEGMPMRPWIEDFSAGYIRRMAPMLPKQGDRAPWVALQSYSGDTKLIVDAPIADDVLHFDRVSARADVDTVPVGGS
jgi:hypothetical protein